MQVAEIELLGTIAEPEDPTPSDGVSGFVNSDGFIVLEGSGQAVLGLDFLSDGGLLSTDGGAAPFGFFLSDKPQQVTLGVLGQANAVTLDGTLKTPVKYSGRNPSEDLTAIWGNTSNELTEFSVTLQDDSSCTVPSLESISDCAENLAQRDEILAQLGLLLADLDADGTVGFSDFLILSDSFGKGSQRYTDGDIDLDGSIGFADFLVLSDQFGKSL